MTSNAPKTSPVRYAGLDGLRALAVILVVVYHLFPPLLPSGFLGVDVFFVISGFLITSLLLREQAMTGRIALADFWRRRARRLLPALTLVVTVCASAAWIIGGDVLLNLGAQVVGAFTFSYNWISISGDTGYFSSGAPELFRNFWSLAVEEQFYVVWPLILPLFLLIPRAWGRAAAALALAAASAAWMASLVSAGGDLTRVYFGTDTHSFGILVGIALAFVLGPILRRSAAPAPSEDAARLPVMVPSVTLPPGWTIVQPKTAPTPKPAPSLFRPAWMDRSGTRVAVSVVGVVAVAGIVASAMMVPADGGITFPGTLLAASILSVIVIATATWPGSAYARGMDAPPLRWIGERSYGIYLWHWPLLVLAMAGIRGAGTRSGVPTWIGVGVLGLTIAAAELSYRFVETPVRRYGFRGTFSRMVSQLQRGPRSRLRALGLSAVAVVVVWGTAAGIAAAPATSGGEAAVAAGQVALDQANQQAATASATPSATPAPSATPTATAEAAPSTPSADPEPTPSPTPITGDEISAVGDSVMLASAPALLERFPGIQIDAAVSRSTWAGPGIVESLAANGELREFVVVALGTNGPVSLDALERMTAIAGPDRSVVLVNAFAPRDWIPEVNADLSAFASSHPGVVVADWSGAISAHTDLLAGDQIHPGASGGHVFADTVATTIDQIEKERAQRQYELEMRVRENLRLHPAPQVR
ncbi:acyltransferase family protein [Microbacterium pumilum]|uniref:Acyltransferase 3 domain-containing protein n=1 Tax=Microbacterium pumilum TaxID=344165 RepID=A0ABN2S8Y7_9MICO